MFRPHTCTILWTVVYLAILGLQMIWSQHKYLFNQWLTYVYAVIFMIHRISLYLITQQFNTNWVIKINLIFFSTYVILICYLLTILSKIQTLLTNPKQFLDFIQINNHQIRNFLFNLHGKTSKYTVYTASSVNCI